MSAHKNLKREFQRRQQDVSIVESDQGLLFKVNHHDEINFIYQVAVSKTLAPSFMLQDQNEDTQQSYIAEVFLREGGKNYNVMEWTQEDLLQDILEQYERHLYFLNVVRN